MHRRIYTIVAVLGLAAGLLSLAHELDEYGVRHIEPGLPTAEVSR